MYCLPADPRLCLDKGFKACSDHRCAQVYQLAKPHKWTARLMPCASQISKSSCSSAGETVLASPSLSAFELRQMRLDQYQACSISRYLSCRASSIVPQVV